MPTRLYMPTKVKITCFFFLFFLCQLLTRGTYGGYCSTQIGLPECRASARGKFCCKIINRSLRDQQEQPPSDTAIRKQWHLIGFYKLSGLLRLPIDYYFLPQAKLHPSDWRSEASWKHLCYWLNLDRYKCLYVYVEGERKLTTEMTDRYNEPVGEILKR